MSIFGRKKRWVFCGSYTDTTDTKITTPMTKKELLKRVSEFWDRHGTNLDDYDGMKIEFIDDCPSPSKKKKKHFRIRRKENRRFITEVWSDEENGWIPLKWHYDCKAHSTGDVVIHDDARTAKHDLHWCCPLTRSLSAEEYDVVVVDEDRNEIKEKC